MICKKCGANVSDGSSVCPACGAGMTASPFMQAADLDGFGSSPVSAPERKPEYVEATQPEIRVNMGGKPKKDATEVPAETVSPAPKQYCTHCGAPMEAGSRFCVRCGTGGDGAGPVTAVGIEERVNEVTTKVWDTVNDVVKGILTLRRWAACSEKAIGLF